jgi:hypothetical protein
LREAPFHSRLRNDIDHEKGITVKLLKTKKVIALAAVMVAASGATAMALTSSAGGAQLLMQNRAETAASVTNSTTFVDLPGAAVTVSVPTDRTELFNARFTAESNCTRAVFAPGWCSTRIVAQRIGVIPVPPPVELAPASGLDYAFDSVATDQHEGHAMERSLRLRAGTYVIKVQRAVTNAAIQFTLDDWHLAVEGSV